jgi:KaiC/GvpD/RAD55 family RecA-like ATPase
MGVVMGGPGDGKSMFLSHMVGVSAFKGLRCCYATLELPMQEVLARIKANIMGIPINHVSGSGMAAAKQRMTAIEHGIGATYIKDFTPHATDVPTLLEWVDSLEQRDGEGIQLIVVDYADKLSAKSDGDYNSARIVYESLRIDAVEKNRWHWTGSQTTRAGGNDQKKVEIHHVANSMHKVRVADLVVTLNLRDEGESLLYHIAKNRYGRARYDVGPLPQAWSIGRIAEVVRGFSEDPGAAGEYVDDFAV